MKYSPIANHIDYQEAYHALSNNPEQAVLEAEKRYHSMLSNICETAIREHKYIILITGPSASGKTTSAKYLASLLEARGKRVNRISLDNFYRNKEELPRWEDGYQNYESIEGLDIPHFDEVMNRLLTKGEAVFPIFDFTTGYRSESTFTLTFDSQTFLILEGIHALNPLLYNVLGSYPAMKLYISVHSKFVDDGNTVLSARNLRLSRRILRDFHYRCTRASDTLNMWKYVLRGEELYIFPFREHADLHIDSTHLYEPFLYHNGVNAMMTKIRPDSPYYSYAQSLLDANERFFPIDYDLVPANSLIQEFIKPKHFDESKIKLRNF